MPLGMSLHFDKATGAWAVEKGVILKRALATSIADRTVKWVVYEKEFENSFAVLFDLIGFGVDYEAFTDRHGAGCSWLGEHPDRSVRLLGTGKD